MLAMMVTKDIFMQRSVAKFRNGLFAAGKCRELAVKQM
jgi:hypothetical protein